MKSQSVWLLLVSLLVVCGMIGCGEKPVPVVEKPKAGVEEPKTVVSKPDVTEEPGLPVEIVNSIGMKLKLIPAGEFLMGDGSGAHQVTLTKPFYLGVHEVTQEQYEKVMGKNPSYFKGAANPVEGVSWDQAVEFCRKLSAKEEMTYHLPTEAQWEYACRAGTTTRWSSGDDEESLREYAWSLWSSDVKTHFVGRRKPNAWGLHDMHGNVQEWCADWYGEDYYAVSPTDDPPGPLTGSFRVCRGGSYSDSAWECTSSRRKSREPSYRHIFLGFRVAAVPSSR